MLRYLTVLLLMVFQVGANGFLLADDHPIIIAHRGASGYLPEHTLAAYQLGMEQGADFIEPDLVLTKDGHLVARHDVYLSTTTDVAARPEFQDRKRELKGKEDWYVFDFTLAELKTLHAKQPFPNRAQSENDKHQIPTFEEIVLLVTSYNSKHGTRIGLYPEMKQPAVFSDLGLDPLIAVLSSFRMMNQANIPFYFQCFDPNFILNLRPKTKENLIMLMYGIEDKETGNIAPNIPLSLIQNSVQGVGISKNLLVDADGKPSGFVNTTHDLGLKVHVWTIRDDIVPEMFENSLQEMKAIFSMGVDGIFADFPDTARTVVNSMKLTKKVTEVE
jgi:glycerophosphoryl diester phosphodiesterase